MTTLSFHLNNAKIDHMDDPWPWWSMPIIALVIVIFTMVDLVRDHHL